MISAQHQSTIFVYCGVIFDTSDSCNFPQPKLTYPKFFWRYVAYEILSVKTENLSQRILDLLIR